MDSLDPIRVAWAAGFYEGEGSYMIAWRRDRAYSRLTIGSTDLDRLELFADVFGAEHFSIRTVKRTPEGAERAHGKSYASRKPSWVLEGRREAGTAAVMDAMYPLLGPRRQGQVDKVRAAVAANPPPRVATNNGWTVRRALRAKRIDEQNMNTLGMA